jgi:hypothetical protein
MKFFIFPTKTISSFMLGLIIGTVVTYGFTYTKPHSSSSGQHPQQLILQTENIPHLPPHEHMAHHTVFDDGHHHTVYSQVYAHTEDIWITGMEFVIENAPGSVLHHAELLNLDSPRTKCDHLPNELINLGEDTLHTTAISFDAPYGILLPRDEQLTLKGMFHNPAAPIGTGDEYYDVSAKIQITYEPVRISSRSRPLEYHFLHLDDDNRCEDQKYTFIVPPETENYRKVATGTPAEDPGVHEFDMAGEIRYIGGHLHGWEGGTYLDLILNNEPIRRYETKQSNQAGILWETPHGRDSIKIKAGDVLSLEAVYDNPMPMPVVGAMGMIGFYFAPEQ